jgi:hypothetical protein
VPSVTENRLLTHVPPFLDFEASSLSSNSYPIEVAWSLSDASIESYLISPAGMEHWTDWSMLSETIHGISRNKLLTDGKSPQWICQRMNDQLSGRCVYTDNPLYDGMWLAELFSAAGHRVKFKLALIDELLFGRVYPDPAARSAAMENILQMKAQARARVGGQHRAKLDVQYLIELYALATKPGQ